MAGSLWEAVGELLEGADIEGIRAHKLGALAARLRRRAGLPVPPDLAGDERGATAAVVMAGPLLQDIRNVCDGPLVLVKGVEVARLYPGSARTFGDVDLIAADADGVQRALVAAGYREVDDPSLFLEHHHLRPLKAPEVGLLVEVHSGPLWPPDAQPPRADEIIDGAVAAKAGVEGILAPSPAHHALILAAHAWSHEPLQTLRDLIDIAVVSSGVSESELQQAAQRWGILKLWRTTQAAIDALFRGGPTTMPLRTWARHLRAVRERTVVDSHLMRWLHVFSELPPREAVSALGAAFRLTLLPDPEESWREKLARTGHSLRHPSEPMSTHRMWSHEVARRRVGSRRRP